MSDINADQRAFWSDQAGPTWVAERAAMDAVLGPVLDLVLSKAGLRLGECVLDIGCGAGTSTVAAAQAVGAEGRALGLDISQSLLDLAVARPDKPDQASFTLADAQTYAFAPAQFDCLLSRFGVMFFADSVAAFANMATALRPGGRVICAAWGAILDNPYFTMPARVVKEVFAPMPKSDPDGPGPFAFRDGEKVCGILAQAGFVDVGFHTHKVMLTPQGNAETVAKLLCEIGPAQSALAYFDASETDRARLISALIEALAGFETPDGIRIPAAINLFEARKPA